MIKSGIAILVPTTDKSNLFVENLNGKLYYNDNMVQGNNKFHLMIVNMHAKNVDMPAININTMEIKKSYKLSDGDTFFKIVSSTDSNLGLPKPDKEFMTEFVINYNMGKRILLVDFDTNIKIHDKNNIFMVVKPAKEIKTY